MLRKWPNPSCPICLGSDRHADAEQRIRTLAYDACNVLYETQLLEFVGVSVIPDMHLAAFKTTMFGRDAESYDKLVKATASR